MDQEIQRLLDALFGAAASASVVEQQLAMQKESLRVSEVIVADTIAVYNAAKVAKDLALAELIAGLQAAYRSDPQAAARRAQFLQAGKLPK